MSDSTDACPAVSDTVVYATSGYATNPTVDHIACFGIYQPGPDAQSMTATMRQCCNNTVEVTRNAELPPAECFFYCNVTINQDPTFTDDSAYDFWTIQQCMAGYDFRGGDAPRGNQTDEYGIRCFPKMETRRNAAPSVARSLSKLGFGVVLLAIGALVLG